jgi:DNA-binding transcriptional ArsR family regulator
VAAYSTAAVELGGAGGLERLSGLLGAVAHPKRLALVAALARRELCVCELVDLLELPQPLISHHLGALRQAGVVRDRRDAHWVYYSLVPEALEELRAGLDEVCGGAGPLPPEARFGAAVCPPAR